MTIAIDGMPFAKEAIKRLKAKEMEQTIPITSVGGANNKALESAVPFKMSGPSEEKIKPAGGKPKQDEEDTSGVVPFFQILDQQISQANKTSDGASNTDKKNGAQERTTAQGDVKPGQQQEILPNLSGSADALDADQAQASFNGLLKQAGLNSGGQTDSGEAKAGGADLQLPINNSPGGEAAGLNEQETQKLKSEAQAAQMEKAAFRETHFPSGQEAKNTANLTEPTMENKEAGKIRPAQEEKDDFSAGNKSLSNTQEIKEFMLKKDHPGKNSSPADLMAENKPQSEAMRTIMGESAAKIREEQKSKFVAGENLNEEVSLSGVNASGGSSAGGEKIKDVSSGKIIDQVAGAIKETAANDGGRVKITLNPPSLGKLEMDVTVRNGKVEVVLVADNKDVQQALNANIEKLKDSLSNQGLTIDRCDVSLQDKKEEYQQNFNRQAYYQDGGSARDGDGRRGNSEEEINSGAGPAAALRTEHILRTINDTDSISLFA